MKPITTSLAVAFLPFISACGGPNEAATVPRAEPAEATSIDIGDYSVHFNAQLTGQLPPEIARTYNIVRSNNRAMLNVSVIDDEKRTSVPADVSVKTVNLTGQLKTVNMRRIDEQEAIYYIGETPVANQETLIFDITVAPEDADTPSEVRFKRQFFTDR